MTHRGNCVVSVHAANVTTEVSDCLCISNSFALYPITISSNLSRNTFPFPWSRPWPVQAVTRLWLLYWAVNFSGPWLTLTGTRLQILLHGSILTGCCHTQTVTRERERERERESSLHQVQVSQYNWLPVVWKWVINLYSHRQWNDVSLHMQMRRLR